ARDDPAARGPGLVARAGREVAAGQRDRVVLDLHLLGALGQVAVHRDVGIRDRHRTAGRGRLAHVGRPGGLGETVALVQDGSTVGVDAAHAGSFARRRGYLRRR